MNTIAEQLNQLNAKTNSKKKAPKKDMESPSTKSSSSFIESISKPFVKLDSIPIAIVESLPKPKSPNYDLLQTISEQIETIDKKKALACIDKTCQQKIDNTSSSSSEEEVVSSNRHSDEVIATIQNTFKEEKPIQNSYREEPLALNKI